MPCEWAMARLRVRTYSHHTFHVKYGEVLGGAKHCPTHLTNGPNYAYMSDLEKQFIIKRLPFHTR